MANEEAIKTLRLAQAQIEWDYPMDYAAAIDMAVEALQALDEIYAFIMKSEASETTDGVLEIFDALEAQDSKTRRLCDTCKHNPPSKKWPCVDCDMREPADRWEAHNVG